MFRMDKKKIDSSREKTCYTLVILFYFFKHKICMSIEMALQVFSSYTYCKALGGPRFLVLGKARLLINLGFVIQLFVGCGM